MDPRQRFWSEEDKWPRDALGYVFLGRAVHIIGNSMFPKEWDRAEPAAPELLAIPESQTAANSIQRYHVHKLLDRDPVEHDLLKGEPRFTTEEWSRGRQMANQQDEENRPPLNRYTAVVNVVVDALLSNDLVSVLRPLDGGEFSKPMAPAEWNTEHLSGRFHYCRMNTVKPLFVHPDDSNNEYIFVAQEGLTALVKELSGSSDVGKGQANPPPETAGLYISPYMQLMFDVVQEFGITESNQSKISLIREFINEQWNDRGLPDSAKLRETMATMVRDPRSQSGGNKKISE